jgi:uncharacterized membrane protein YqiK
MNAGVVVFIVSLLALIFLLSRVLKQKRPQAPLIRRLRESGVRVGDRAADGGRSVLGAAGAADDRP